MFCYRPNNSIVWDKHKWVDRLFAGLHMRQLSGPVSAGCVNHMIATPSRLTFSRNNRDLIILDFNH
jgi:hypothetical protein